MHAAHTGLLESFDVTWSMVLFNMIMHRILKNCIRVKLLSGISPPGADSHSKQSLLVVCQSSSVDEFQMTCPAVQTTTCCHVLPSHSGSCWAPDVWGQEPEGARGAVAVHWCSGVCIWLERSKEMVKRCHCRFRNIQIDPMPGCACLGCKKMMRNNYIVQCACADIAYHLLWVRSKNWHNRVSSLQSKLKETWENPGRNERKSNKLWKWITREPQSQDSKQVEAILSDNTCFTPGPALMMSIKTHVGTISKPLPTHDVQRQHREYAS